MKFNQARNLAALLATILVLSSGFNNCGQRTQMSLREANVLAAGALRGGTSGGNPALTSLEFGPFTASTGRDEKRPSSPVQDFSICLAEMDFRSADGTALAIRYDRQISLMADGTAIGDVTIPIGSYDEIVIVVDNTCNTGVSFSVTNNVGTFTGSAGTKMVFDGHFVSDTSGHSVSLDIEAIVAALAAAASDKDALDGLGVDSPLDTISAVTEVPVNKIPGK